MTHHKLAQEHGEIFALRENRCEMTATGTNSEPARFLLEQVLGVAPLYQFLVPFPDGRWQLTQAAFDPARKEWFDIFSDGRRSGEWGHWAGRGMNWNSMCAACHNTMVRKNYNWRSDSYATAMAEMGVSCEACHGPRKAHVEWRRINPKATHDPPVQRVSMDAMLSTCGSCHARRSELTGSFKPGDSFFDHYALSIPDESELLYPDGQVRDEDFEFTSFLSSKMHAAGVRCGDCHEPHSGKTILPGYMLCMRCHAGTSPAGVAPAPKIEPLSHSRHKQGSAGNQCVE